VRFRIICLGVLITWTLAVAAASAAVGDEPSGGPSLAQADRPPLNWKFPDGGLFLNLPADWESNEKLAQDNNAVGFLHPGGMASGQEIPVWVVVERRLFSLGQSFDAMLRECLEEGKTYEFSAQDSSFIKTADGRTLINYRFNASKEGAERALAFLATPDGAILFRQQAANAEIWKKHSETIGAIFRGVRFLANQTQQQPAEQEETEQKETERKE